MDQNAIPSRAETSCRECALSLAESSTPTGKVLPGASARCDDDQAGPPEVVAFLGAESGKLLSV